MRAAFIQEVAVSGSMFHCATAKLKTYHTSADKTSYINVSVMVAPIAQSLEMVTAKK